MESYHIHIKGLVQGVGFRPYIYKLANKYGLKGWVKNGVDGVRIALSVPQDNLGKTASDDIILNFLEELKENPPCNSWIREISIYRKNEKTYPDFQIKESQNTGEPNLLITPDLGICSSCKEEISDPNNRRYHYPFTTCLNCGPRYSIIQDLPYDRINTSMKDFKICPECSREYQDPDDPRFHSQTNSCPNCPVTISWHDSNGKLLSKDSEEVLIKADKALKKGKILGVKGIGGFLLLVDARNKDSIIKLRERKTRPRKPFAVLYPNQKTLLNDVNINPEELKAWNSIESPIVLFGIKENPKSGIQADLIAPGLNRIGAMQPYAPLLEILSTKFGKPLVATSGNLSGSPIYHQNEEAIKGLGQIADYLLLNDRPILVPQDDSVQGFSKEYGKRVIFRRSRGYAPNFIQKGFIPPKQNILCMGPMLKSNFSFNHKKNTYISQYLGNTSNFDVQNSFKKVLNHLSNTLQFKPDYIVADMHPDYFATQFGEELSRKLEIPLVRVQHHKTHFASVLSENNKLRSADPILGVIWDGTGYGEDGNIWGGEFFLFEDGRIDRIKHFNYFPHIVGEKMSLDPRLSALSISKNVPNLLPYLNSKFKKVEWEAYLKIISKKKNILSSSVGRLFDAVASILGFEGKQSYEGEAASILQAWAEEYFSSHSEKVIALPVLEPSPSKILEAVAMDLLRGLSKFEIAAKFHVTLTRIIRNIAEKAGVQSIAFSGGVFQNTLLIDLIQKEMGNDFELLFHQQLSPNDECISFGQLAMMDLKLNFKQEEKQTLKLSPN